jgi:hypothetical protein
LSCNEHDGAAKKILKIDSYYGFRPGAIHLTVDFMNSTKPDHTRSAGSTPTTEQYATLTSPPDDRHLTPATIFGPTGDSHRVDAVSQRRLYSRENLTAVLSLSAKQVDILVNTGQITPILICGQERVDSREVSALIDTYTRVHKRKTNNNDEY